MEKPVSLFRDEYQLILGNWQLVLVLTQQRSVTDLQ